jgi:Probable lipoprotein LpqN
MVCASRAATVVLMVAAGLIASCTRYVDDARAVASDDQSTTASQCETVDAPLTTIPPLKHDEPVMKIPQPQEWTRSTKMDSELIRFAMVNRGPGEDGAVASAVVTLEKPPGVDEADVIFEMERHALETMAGATDLQVTEHTLCGLPAETVKYRTPEEGRIDPHPATVVMAVIHLEDRTYAVTITVGSDGPDDPTFQRDADMILKGFQLLPPAG